MRSTKPKVKKVTAKDYLKIVEWSEEDQCFIGSAPPLIGTCCHGKTEAEVIDQLVVIVQEWINIFNENGLPFPAIAQEKYSGKFLLRTGEDLHRLLAIRAFQAGDSLNNYVIKRLQESA